MSFNAIMDTPSILRGIFEAMSFLIDETTVDVTEGGIKIHAMDSSHVGMLMASLPSNLFENYSYVAPKVKKNERDVGIHVGVNISDVVKILRRAKSTDKIELSGNSETNELVVLMKSEKSKRTFKLKSKEVQSIGLELEQIEESLKEKYVSSFTIDGTLFDEIIKDSLIISDLMRIEVSTEKKQLDFLAYDESGEVEIQLDLGGGFGLENVEVKEDSQGLYSLNFLENFIKIQSVTDTITMSLGQNIPLKLHGLITRKVKDGDGNEIVAGEGRVIYFLAPRVEDSDEDDDDFEEDFGEEEDFDDDFNDDDNQDNE